MKAKWRDKEFEVTRVGSECYLYDISQVEFIDEKVLDDTFDEVYWENLKHQYAGMAMHAYIIASHISQFSFCENDMKDCVSMATALVEKLKESKV